MEHDCLEELKKAREEVDYLKGVLAKVANELAIVSAERRKLEQMTHYSPVPDEIANMVMQRLGKQISTSRRDGVIARL